MDGAVAILPDALQARFSENRETSRAPAKAARFAAVMNISSTRLSDRKRQRLTELLRARFGDALGAIAYADGECLGDVIRMLTEASPRAIMVIGGDGTARTALEILTPMNIAVAPLPGGTLNRISKLVYGDAPIPAVLDRIADGAPRWIAGGRIGPRRFYCAAGLGAAMQLHHVREHLRRGAFGEAWRTWRSILPDLFSREIGVGDIGRRVQCAIVGVGPIDAAFGLRRRKTRDGLEVATASWRNLWHMASLAPSVIFGGWRARHHVVTSTVESARFSSQAGGIPALLDGEFTLLPDAVSVRHQTQAGLVWAPSEIPR